MSLLRKTTATNADCNSGDRLESITSIGAPNTRGFAALPNELYLEILSYYPSYPLPPHRLTPKEDKECAFRYPTLLSLCQTCRSSRRFFLKYLWERVEMRPAVVTSDSDSSSVEGGTGTGGGGLGLLGLRVQPIALEDGKTTTTTCSSLPFPGLSRAPFLCTDDGQASRVANERRAEILSSQLSVLLQSATQSPSSSPIAGYVRIIDVTLHSHLFEDIFTKLIRLLCSLKNLHTLRLDIRCRRSLIWVIDASLREPSTPTQPFTTTQPSTQLPPTQLVKKISFPSIKHLFLSSNTLEILKHAPNVQTLTPSNIDDAFGLIDLLIQTQTPVESLQVLGPVRYTSRWMNEFGARFPALRKVTFAIPAVPISKESLSEMASLAQLKNLQNLILEREVPADASKDDNLRDCCIKVAKDLGHRTMITMPADEKRAMFLKDRETACIRIHR